MDYGVSRSEYMKVMLGDRGNNGVSIKPDQLNDVGDTSIDVASLSDEDIDFRMSSYADQASKSTQGKTEDFQDQNFWQRASNFFSLAQSSSERGFLDMFDDIGDAVLSVIGGVAGGYWGKENDFTRKIQEITSFQWQPYVQKVADIISFSTQAPLNWNQYFNFTSSGVPLPNLDYLMHWDPESMERQYNRQKVIFNGAVDHGDTLDSLWETGTKVAGRIFGEVLLDKGMSKGIGKISEVATQRASAGLKVSKFDQLITKYPALAKLGARTVLGVEEGMGEGFERATQEGASYQGAATYGLARGAIKGVTTAVTYGLGAKGYGPYAQGTTKFGGFILSKTGSGVGAKAVDIIQRAGLNGVINAAETSSDPVLKQITYDANALQKAYGDDEARANTIGNIFQSAIFSSLTSALMQGAPEAIKRLKLGKTGYTLSYMEQYVAQHQSKASDYLTKSANAKNYKEAKRYFRLAEKESSMASKFYSDLEEFLGSSDFEKAKTEAGNEYWKFKGNKSKKYGDLKPNANGRDITMTAFQLLEDKYTIEDKAKAVPFARWYNAYQKMTANSKDYVDGEYTVSSPVVDDNGSKLSEVKTNDGKDLFAVLSNMKDGIVSIVLANRQVALNFENIDGEAMIRAKGYQEAKTLFQLELDEMAKNALPAKVALDVKVDGKPATALIDFNGMPRAEIEKLSNLTMADFKRTESGNYVAFLDDKKALAISIGQATGEIIPASQAETWKPKKPEMLQLKAEPSVVKQAANAKEGKVISLSSASKTATGVKKALYRAIGLSGLDGEIESEASKAEVAKTIFDTFNLGDDEQRDNLKVNLKKKLLASDFEYSLPNPDGGEADSFKGTLGDFLKQLDPASRAMFDKEYDALFNALIASAKDSNMSKAMREIENLKAEKAGLTDKYENKITELKEKRDQAIAKFRERIDNLINMFDKKFGELFGKYKELKSQTRSVGHIEKHRNRLLDRYGHGEIKDFGPDFDFNHQGFRVITDLFYGLELTLPGKNSYTGSSVRKSLIEFLDRYKIENYQKEVDDGLVSVDSIYVQAMRDMAVSLLNDIEANASVDKNGKVTYKQLSAEQLGKLSKILDLAEQMPKKYTKDRVESVSLAKAADKGVRSYVSKTSGKGKSNNPIIGKIRDGYNKLVEAYGERYSNQPDALKREIGDNVLTREIDNLYLGYAKLQGKVDEFQGKINDSRKRRNAKKTLEKKSKVITDTKGKKVKLKFLARIYLNMLSGEESNNVKYMNANTLYIKGDPKNPDKITQVVSVKYSDMPAIEQELKDNGLLDHALELHRIDNEDLKAIYDEDYDRDNYGLPNTNSIKNYTSIELESNKKVIGKGKAERGVVSHNRQKDRVEKIPEGVHLVIRDPEQALMSDVKNQLAIHFLEPVRAKINAMLNTKIGENGETLKEYLSENKPNALILLARIVAGAYGKTPDEGMHLLDIPANAYSLYLLGFNVGSALRQPISIMFSNDISLGTVVKYTVPTLLSPKYLKNSHRLIKEIEKEFPLLALRWKRNEAVLGSMSTAFIREIQQKLSAVFGIGLKLNDALTVNYLAVGLLALQGEELGYGEIGTPTNDAYVMEHYPKFYATQVSNDKINMSGARAGYYGTLGTVTSFMTGAVQGQIGYLLRAGQQLQQFDGVSEEDLKNKIEAAKKEEQSAKQDFEDAQKRVEKAEEEYENAREARDNGKASSDDVKAAKDKIKEERGNLKDKSDEYSSKKADKEDAETEYKNYKHFKEMGGSAGVVASRLASVLVSGVVLWLISALNSWLKGQKEWGDLDWENSKLDLVLNSTTVGWMPLARDVANWWKGYDVDVPEIAMYKMASELVQAVGKYKENPTDANAKAIMRNAIESASAFLGIPTSNIWKYVNGMLKTFNPQLAIQANDLLYGTSYTSVSKTAKEYAEKGDISKAADYYLSIYGMYKTGDISRDVAVEEAKLVQQGFNPLAKQIPTYYTDENDEKVYLTDDQRSQFKQAYSKANEQVEAIIKHVRYNRLESESKAKVIKKAYDAYYEVARHETYGIEPTSKLGKFLAYCGGDYDIALTLLLIEENSKLADTKRQTKKEQAIKLVNQQQMTKTQKLLTLYLMGYGVSSESKKSLQNYLVSLGFSKKQADEFLP